ncbi:MAG TPA: tripartite tricarboxylate transporter substrate binding protein [Xanthobacteraceae bacterium]|nr:tripartite tricarboxylate transporter substrate binding protein [Xanthobacteraceae bacterium]
MMRHLIGMLLAAALALGAAPASAQTYPTRPIKLLVAYPPGGASDLIARLFAEALSKRLGQPVVVENRAGANGNIAGEVAAHAEPDGYTLLLGPSSVFTINPHLYVKMQFDPLKDLVPIASLIQNELVLTANKELTAGMGFKAFIAFARNARPPLFYASIGNGSEHQLAMELLKRAASIEMTHVAYKGGGPAALGVIGGSAAAMFGGGSVVSLVKSGQLHALAISGPRRSAELPDLPTIGEFYPGYDVTLWQGLFVTAGTPPAIVARLREAATAIRVQPDIAQKLAAAGAGEPWVLGEAEFAARIRADSEKYRRVLEQIGAKVQ